MVRDHTGFGTPGGPTERLLAVLETVAARRLAGEPLSDEQVIAEHPNLMPDLSSGLGTLRAVERARLLATEPAGSSTGPLPDGPRDPWGGSGARPADFSGYEFREEVGRGAMGVVYRARQTHTGRDVAIKVLFEGPFSASHDRIRFEREARILAQLRHPNVVTVYDTGTMSGRFYIVMDYVDGVPLDRYLTGRPPPLRDRLAVFAKICDAVGAAHVRGIIHRDLKPGNIRIDGTGEPHVLDFGLAKASWDDEEWFAHSVTATGQFVGSLPWASPEQASGGSAGVDLRSDVYSLGVILYQMMTASFPYPVTGGLRAILDNIITADPTRPRTLTRDVDSELETIVLKCLSKEADRRYQSAVELALDIRRYLAGEPIDAKRDSTWYLLSKSVRRHRMAVSAAVLFVLSLVAFGVTMSVLYRRSQADALRTQRTLTFLEDTLFQASSQRLGAETTLIEAIDTAAAKLDSAFVAEPSVSAALHYTIGNLYETVWRARESAAHLRTALELYKAELGPEHPDTVRCQVLLGMVLAELRRPEALNLQREALEIRLRQRGPDDPLVAESKAELAYVLWRTPTPREWTEAARYYDEAIDTYRRIGGENRPEFPRCLHACGSMYQALGRLEEAQTYFAESLTRSRQLLGSDHQFVIECMLEYSEVLEGLGRMEEAEALLRDVLAAAPTRFGQRWVPGLLRNMASLKLNAGDPGQAVEWLQRSIAATLHDAADRHPTAADRLNELAGRLSTGANDLPARLELCAEGIRGVAALPDQSSAAAGASLTLGSILMADGPTQDFAKASDALGQAVGGLSLNLGETHQQTASARMKRAECLIRLGQHGKAESLLLNAHEALRGTLGGDHPTTRGAAAKLVELYDAAGEPDRAALFRSEGGDAPHP